MEKMNEELTKNSSQKAKTTSTASEKRITKKVLLDLNKQWRNRWNRLMDKQQEVRD